MNTQDDLFQRLGLALRPQIDQLEEVLDDWKKGQPKFKKDKFGNMEIKTEYFNVWIGAKYEDRIFVNFEIDTSLFDLDTKIEEHPNDPDTKEIEISLSEAVDNVDEKELILKAIELIKIKL